MFCVDQQHMGEQKKKDNRIYTVEYPKQHSASPSSPSNIQPLGRPSKTATAKTKRARTSRDFWCKFRAHHSVGSLKIVDKQKPQILQQKEKRKRKRKQKKLVFIPQIHDILPPHPVPQPVCPKNYKLF